MKKAIPLLLLFYIVKINGQFKEKTLVYGTFEIQVGNYFGFNTNIDYVYNNIYSFKLGYTGLSKIDNNVPIDFERGNYYWGKPLDRLGNYYFLFGKVYQINNKNTKKIIRVDMAVGLGYLIIREPINFKYSESGLFSNSNYTWDYNKKEEISFVFNPKVEFLLTSSFGVNFSPLLQISKSKIYYGAGVGILFRVVKNKSKK